MKDDGSVGSGGEREGTERMMQPPPSDHRMHAHKHVLHAPPPPMHARSSPLRFRARVLALLGVLLVLSSLPSALGVRLWSSSFPYPAWRDGGVYPHSLALFAPDPAGADYNVTAPLHILSANPTLCTDVQLSPAAVRGKILVALRDSACDFLSRAQRAAAAGAAGLIIADNKDNAQFDSQFLGPYRRPPAVSIPVVFVLRSTYLLMMRQTSSAGNHQAWEDTLATINMEGLIFDMDDYYAAAAGSARYSNMIKFAIVAAPMLVVAYSWWLWYMSHRDSRNAPAQQAPIPQPQAQPVAAGGEVAVPVAEGVVVDVEAGQGGMGRAFPSAALPSQPRPAQPSRFEEGEMNAISLPVPPHLSSGDMVGGPSSDGGRSSNGSGGGASINGSLGHDAIEVNLHSPPMSQQQRSSRSHSVGVDESEGALLGSGAPDSADMSPMAGGARPAPQSRSLARPLLPLPGPSIPTSTRIYYRVLKGVSSLGKPPWILRVNALIYLVHAVCALVILVSGWNETCVSSNQSMVSLWLARALIGLRICWWQTHSSTARPTCLDIFFKGWADCIFLFTGSLSSFSEAQRRDCEVNAPITFSAVEAWTVLIFITYGGRVLLFILDRLCQQYSSRVPHLLAIGSRSLLSLSQGGLSCAGPLDANQPATQLDLMLIPTVSFARGMYSDDDAVCGVCLGDYENGEELRVLHCNHHFHRVCVDTWLMQKNNCPTCRRSLDSRPEPRREAQPAQQRSPMPAAPVAAAPMQRPPSPSQVGRGGFGDGHGDGPRIAAEGRPYLAAGGDLHDL